MTPRHIYCTSRILMDMLMSLYWWSALFVSILNSANSSEVLSSIIFYRCNNSLLPFTTLSNQNIRRDAMSINSIFTKLFLKLNKSEPDHIHCQIKAKTAKARRTVELGLRRTSPMPPPFLRPWFSVVNIHMTRESQARCLPSRSSSSSVTIHQTRIRYSNKPSIIHTVQYS